MKKYTPAGIPGLVLVLIFSLGYLYFTLGLAFITGHSGYWAKEAGDVIQHLAGINHYISSSWQFPLLAFDSLHYPEGTSVVFVDGIPIYAFLLKIFLPKNIGFINPLGYWVALNIILQGVAAWWITKELEVKSWVFLIFLMTVFLTYPAWLDRLRQVALMSHWLILFAIALYIRGCRKQYLPRWGWIALIFGAFYIHLYLFAMVCCIYLAVVLDTKQTRSKQYFISVLLPFLILGISLFLFLLPLPPGIGVGGKLGYEMNLLAPIYGGKLIQIQADMSHTLIGVNYNYLGLGVIIIFLWGIFFYPDKNREIIKRHPVFFIILFGFFIYSLSDKVYFGGILIAKISYSPVLNPIITQFRTAERFFWPVGYTISVVSLYVLYSQLKSRVFAGVMLFFLFIQCVDIGSYYEKFKDYRYKPYQPILNYVALDNALGKKTKYIYLYPKYLCNQHTEKKSYPSTVIIPLMRYTAERHLKFNTGYIARHGSDCNNMKKEIAQSKKNESVYMFAQIDYKTRGQIYNAIGGESSKIKCENISPVYVCRFIEK